MSFNPGFNLDSGGGSDSDQQDDEESDGLLSDPVDSVTDTVDDTVSGVQDTVDETVDTVSGTVDAVQDTAQDVDPTPPQPEPEPAPEPPEIPEPPTQTVQSAVDPVADATQDIAQPVQKVSQSTVETVTSGVNTVTPEPEPDPTGGAFGPIDEMTEPSGGAFQETGAEQVVSDEFGGEVVDTQPEQVISDEFQDREFTELERATTTDPVELREEQRQSAEQDSGLVASGRGEVDTAQDVALPLLQTRQTSDAPVALNVDVPAVTEQEFEQEAREFQRRNQDETLLIGPIEEATRPGERSEIDINTEVTDELTRGGVIPETAEGDEALLPGQVAGLDISEEQFRSTAEDIRGFNERFEENEPVTLQGVEIENQAVREAATEIPGVSAADEPGTVDIAGGDAPERALQGAAGFGVELAATGAQSPALADTAIEIGQNAPRVSQEEGAGTVARELGELGLLAGQETVREAREEPIRQGGAAIAGIATGVFGGRALGQASRTARDRVRTVGSTDITDDVAGDDVLQFAETGGQQGRRFPPARTESGDVPSETEFVARQREILENQASEFTPEAVEQRFAEQGFTEGEVFLKTLDVEPEGPGRGRAGQGLEAPEADTEQASEFETPGISLGPELSPNFLRIQSREGFSLRPGLPDLGGRPTTVLARTALDETDAQDVRQLRDELIDREGEATPQTLSPDEATAQEAEVLAPPGAEFQDIGGSATRNIARRLGIGSDFRVEIEGRRVPARPIVPDERDGSGFGGVFGVDERGQADLTGPETGDGVAFRGSIDELRSEGGQPVDRPFPVGTVGGGTPIETPRDFRTERDPSRGGTDQTRQIPDRDRERRPSDGRERGETSGRQSGAGSSPFDSPSVPSVFGGVSSIFDGGGVSAPSSPTASSGTSDATITDPTSPIEPSDPTSPSGPTSGGPSSTPSSPTIPGSPSQPGGPPSEGSITTPGDTFTPPGRPTIPPGPDSVPETPPPPPPPDRPTNIPQVPPPPPPGLPDTPTPPGTPSTPPGPPTDTPAPTPSLPQTPPPPPFTPGIPGNQRTERETDNRTDRDDEEFGFINPQTPEFVNPVASGSQFLFGEALGDSVGGSSTESVSSLLPVEQDAQGQPTGEVEPLSERGRQALDSDPFNIEEF